MNKPHQGDIYDFIEHLTGFDLTYESVIEDEAYVYGDDAQEFMIAFRKKFNVDLSNFMFDDYFSPETDFMSRAIRRYLTKNKPKKKLQVKHLMKAIEMGRLDEEEIAIVNIE